MSVLLLLVCAAFPAVAAEPPQASADGAAWESNSGIFRVSYVSRLDPIAINRIHTWVLHVESRAGEPVTGARLEVSGTMPAHDHGLPTQPRVTRELGNGDYLLEGVRFHMHGAWEMSIIIEASGKRDVVLVPLQL